MTDTLNHKKIRYANLLSLMACDGLKSATIKVLFDSVSHHTFMKDKLAKRVQLSSQCKEALSVSTFAAKRSQDVDTYVIQFSLMTKDGTSLPLQANVINQITGPIYCGHYSHLI